MGARERVDSADAVVLLRTTLWAALEAIHLVHCCEPFDSRIHRADRYTDDCCALCKRIREALDL